MCRLTECIQPPPVVELLNSAISCPNGILLPHSVAAGFGSMSFT
jgi:hypothetical protein